jgi:GrpB-like predicted nucleotidyltransferase (UPF0157 family)
MHDAIRPIIGPYESRPAACRNYDPRAAVVAQKVAESIAPHLPQIRVEHVGSTAVPGCAGKGIVDLMIAVPEGVMDAVKTTLEGLGFQRQTGRDPFPEDRPMRVGSMVHDGELFFVHVHAIAANSPEIEEMRFFRACLRSDPELLKAYVAQKREIISNGTTDPFDYTHEKGKFIKAVLG